MGYCQDLSSRTRTSVWFRVGILCNTAVLQAAQIARPEGLGERVLVEWAAARYGHKIQGPIPEKLLD